MATLKIDPKTGLPIIPKEWLTITRDAPSWNEAMNADVPGHQRVVFTPEALALLQNTPEGFGNWSNYDWGFSANDGGPQNYMWQEWTDPTLMSVLKKTGEREGTRYAYSLDESGNYVPGEVLGTEEMYTNNGDMNKKALMAAAAVVGGGLLGNLAMTGNMFNAAAPGAMNFGGAGVGSAVGGGGGSIMTPGISEQALQTLGSLGVGGAESAGGALAAADAAAINAAGLTNAAPWLSQVGYGGAPPNGGPPGSPPKSPPTTPGKSGIPDWIKDAPDFIKDNWSWMRPLAGLLGGAAMYKDAKDKDGQKVGGAPDTLKDIQAFRAGGMQSPYWDRAPQIGGASGLLGKRADIQRPTDARTALMAMLNNSLSTNAPQLNNPFANIFDPRFWS